MTEGEGPQIVSPVPFDQPESLPKDELLSGLPTCRCKTNGLPACAVMEFIASLRPGPIEHASDTVDGILRRNHRLGMSFSIGKEM
jgi:hypothetical protein